MWKWLRRSGLNHKDPEVRARSIAALNPQQRADERGALQRLAAEDADPQVRKAATRQLQDHATLLPLLSDDVVAAEARAVLLEQLRNGALRLSADPQLPELCLQHGGAELVTELLTQLREHCPDAESTAALALQLRDPERAQVLTSPLLRDEAGLSVLEKASRPKDKSLNRYARAELDQLRHAQRDLDEACGRLVEIDSAIQRELRGAQDIRDANHIAKLMHLRGTREIEAEAAGNAATILADYNLPATLVPICTDLDELSARIDAAQNPTVNPQEPAASNDTAAFDSLLSACTSLQDTLHNEALSELTQSQFESLSKQWQLHSADVPAQPEQQAAYEQTRALLQERQDAEARVAASDLAAFLQPPDVAHLTAGKARTALKGFQQNAQRAVQEIGWPGVLAPPKILAAVAQQIDAAREQRDSLMAQLDGLETQMREHLDATEQALQEGASKQALQAIRAARNLQKQGVHQHDKRLNGLSARLQELQDWQKFATNPKRQSLLDDVEALAAEPLAPEVQAERLRALREAWNALGIPRDATENELQQQFDAHAATAFSHCEEYFAEKTALRARNLEARQALCEQLKQYLEETDWTSADMQAAEAIMRAARDEWRKFHPCDRRSLKPVQNQFERLQSQLHNKVKTAWDSNVEAKRSIIAAAKALLEQDDVGTQVDGAKQLQARWREIGKTPRGIDQRLWKEFRAICDEIFSQRDAARDAQQQQRAANHAAVNTALDALAGLLDAGLPTVAEFNEAVVAVEEAAGEDRLSKSAHQRLGDLRDRFATARRTQARQKDLHHIDELARWDADVSAWEAAADGASMQPPHPWFEARVGGSAGSEDWLALTLEAEIAAGMESQGESQVRMALQIELINQGRKPADEDYKALLRRWCEAGPKTPYDKQLAERFFAAIRARAG
ncbi:MAG: DUF349 domain-containing protein [Pseudomonadota bacterium]